jgi:hypothetical protein
MAMRPWRNVPLPRLSVASIIAFVGWCGFAAYLLVQARAGPALIWADSKDYAKVASRSLTSGGFWVGQRPPLTPLVIKMFGSSTGYLTAQAVVAALAWGVLAWTVGRLVAPGWPRIVATWTILAFASTLPITLWDRSVLSESLALSLLALVAAGLIWTSRSPTWPRIAATSVACLVFAATRDAQEWTVAFLGLAMAAFALLRLRQSRAGALRAAVLAACLLVVVGVTEWGTLASYRTTQNVADVFYVRVFPYPGRVAWFAAHGMPDQPRIDALARRTTAQAQTAPVVSYPVDDPAFAPLQHWLATDASDTYLLWLTSHPLYVITEPLQRPERAYNFAQGDLTYYAAVSGRMASPLTVVFWPPLLGLIFLAVFAATLGFPKEVRRGRPWQMMVAFTVIGVGSMLVAWHGDGQEVTRHTIEGLAEVRLGIWILLVIGLFGLDQGQPDVVVANPDVAEKGSESDTAPAAGVRLAHDGRRHSSAHRPWRSFPVSKKRSR